MGEHAAWLLFAHLLWGLLLGAGFPLVQDRVKRKIGDVPSPREQSLRRRNKLGHAPQRYRPMSSRRET
jgi:hypothetical protein